MKEIKITKNGETRIHIELICSYCFSVFNRRKDLALKEGNKYCSYDCSREHKIKVALTSSTKICSFCKKETARSLKFFYSKNTSVDGLTSRCKNCIDKFSGKSVWIIDNKSKVASLNRKGHLKRTYNMSPEEYLLKLKEQNNLCAICGLQESRTFKGKIKHLSIDHDHKTGKVRKLLCDDCNNGLGRFKDSPTLLQKALEYLQCFEDKINERQEITI